MHRNFDDGFDAASILTDNLDHLPDSKRRELARTLEILFDEVQSYQSRKLSGRKAESRVLKVILYGSFARGDWVEDRISGYRSDFDLLVVVNTPTFAEDDDLWIALDDRLIQMRIAHHIKTPVSLIVHSLHDVNDQLARGRPFFIDVFRDGKVLYETPGHPFAEPKPLTEKDAREEAKLHFDQWYQLSKEALKSAEWMLEQGFVRDSAFMLHQTTERAYHAVLLTLTLYSPKSHRIKDLRSKAEGIDARLIEAWPRNSRVARRHFELLVRAYVEARYSAKYKITAEELRWLIERVKHLQQLVELICQEKLI